MVPSAIVRCERIPLTPNGKIDRKALPAPERAPAEAQQVAPQDALEGRLAGIWSEVLGHTPIGVRDGFFGLGGQYVAGYSADEFHSAGSWPVATARLLVRSSDRRTVGSDVERQRRGSVAASRRTQSLQFVRIEPI